VRLSSRFEALTGSATAASALLARYAEPHRRYHTAEHLEEVLGWVDALADLAGDPVAVELAAWYHDAVHDPEAPAGDSERRSAELAVAELSQAGLAAPVVAEVARLVRLTAGHDAEAADRNGAVLADADLAILGADPARYARYAAAVRAEYAHFDDSAWGAGRTAVLRGFADRPRLYVTDRAHDRLDAPARRNLTWELSTLTHR
jgi:predicted metal-dependent HD superfamily phosphohydrolase